MLVVVVVVVVVSCLLSTVHQPSAGVDTVSATTAQLGTSYYTLVDVSSTY